MSEVTEVDIATNLEEVRQRVAKACDSAGRDASKVRLVAVSKTKPLNLLRDAYNSGQRAFGENYAQELVEKAKQFGDDGLEGLEWHFIGGLQSNKAAMLVKSVVPYGKLTIETVSTLKVAKKLDNAMSANFDGQVLSIFVQINTSGEESKSGVQPNEAAALCKQIVDECEHLELKGVMTIGAPGDVDCLESLVACRDDVAAELGIDKDTLEVSMGMSGDFEVAIAKGSTNVRVGSTIFGARDYSNNKA
eukprot:CAMPEP_0198122798 /NCGR_PEP_ID=MMETSP1442-20131203/35849_1 /TAXON_ID= /ORGANISM="Craspedostauros australis, Strain CCMP3328" /LENGTH=247 /DNA_ID=CAMNT_0043781885 /DNA_START=266 /DNA_END=1009 /DNA_ORIENTATION=+